MTTPLKVSELKPGGSYVIRVSDEVGPQEAERIMATFAMIAPGNCRFLVLNEGVSFEELTEDDLARLKEAWDEPRL